MKEQQQFCFSVAPFKLQKCFGLYKIAVRLRLCPICRPTARCLFSINTIVYGNTEYNSNYKFYRKIILTKGDDWSIINLMMNNTTKEKLVAAGTKVILEKGYNAAGLQEILAEAKVPKGSFYHYFKSKEDFCISIIDYYMTEYINNNLSILSSKSLPARERIILFFSEERDRYFKKKCFNGCLIVKLITEMSQISSPIRIELQNVIQIWLKALSSCISDGMGSKITGRSPEFMAEYIHFAWIGALTRMQANQSIEPLDIFLKFLDEQVADL